MTGQTKNFRSKKHDGSANPIDIYVGRRIHDLRTSKGWSQTQLASLLGITFQQIQKYEKGLNRISASRLWYTAQLMGVSVDYFFNGISVELWKESFKLLPPLWKKLDLIVWFSCMNGFLEYFIFNPFRLIILPKETTAKAYHHKLVNFCFLNCRND